MEKLEQQERVARESRMYERLERYAEEVQVRIDKELQGELEAYRASLEIEMQRDLFTRRDELEEEVEREMRSLAQARLAATTAEAEQELRKQMLEEADRMREKIWSQLDERTEEHLQLRQDDIARFRLQLEDQLLIEQSQKEEKINAELNRAVENEVQNRMAQQRERMQREMQLELARVEKQLRADKFSKLPELLEEKLATDAEPFLAEYRVQLEKQMDLERSLREEKIQDELEADLKLRVRQKLSEQERLLRERMRLEVRKAEREIRKQIEAQVEQETATIEARVMTELEMQVEHELQSRLTELENKLRAEMTGSSQAKNIGQKTAARKEMVETSRQLKRKGWLLMQQSLRGEDPTAITEEELSQILYHEVEAASSKWHVTVTKVSVEMTDPIIINVLYETEAENLVRPMELKLQMGRALVERLRNHGVNRALDIRPELDAENLVSSTVTETLDGYLTVQQDVEELTAVRQAHLKQLEKSKSEASSGDDTGTKLSGEELEEVIFTVCSDEVHELIADLGADLHDLSVELTDGHIDIGFAFAPSPDLPILLSANEVKTEIERACLEALQENNVFLPLRAVISELCKEHGLPMDGTGKCAECPESTAQDSSEKEPQRKSTSRKKKSEALRAHKPRPADQEGGADEGNEEESDAGNSNDGVSAKSGSGSAQTSETPGESDVREGEDKSDAEKLAAKGARSSSNKKTAAKSSSRTKGSRK